jgi:hypothetical protein
LASVRGVFVEKWQSDVAEIARFVLARAALDVARPSVVHVGTMHARGIAISELSATRLVCARSHLAFGTT